MRTSFAEAYSFISSPIRFDMTSEPNLLSERRRSPSVNVPRSFLCCTNGEMKASFFLDTHVLLDWTRSNRFSRGCFQRLHFQYSFNA